MSDRFEENLRALLTRAYEPPHYRREFYDALLARLKAEQAAMKRTLLTQTDRRKRLILGAFLAAASAAFVVAAALALNFSRTMPTHAPALGKSVSASAEQELPKKPAEEGAESYPRFFALRDIHAPGGLEYQNIGDTTWRRLEADAFALQPGMSLQVAKAGQHAIAHFRLGDGKRAIALQSGTALKNEEGRLTLLTGGLYAAVGEQESALEMAVANRQFTVAPGSEIFVKKEAKSGYAAAGEPAPHIMVMKGEAIVRDHLATRLPGGYLFFLYESPIGAVAGQSLEETELVRDIGVRAIATASSAMTRDAVAAAQAVRRPREVLALGAHLLLSQGERLVDIRCRGNEAAERVVAGSPRFAALARAYPEIECLAHMRCTALVACGDKFYEIVPSPTDNKAYDLKANR